MHLAILAKQLPLPIEEEGRVVETGALPRIDRADHVHRVLPGELGERPRDVADGRFGNLFQRRAPRTKGCEREDLGSNIVPWRESWELVAVQARTQARLRLSRRKTGTKVHWANRTRPWPFSPPGARVVPRINYPYYGPCNTPLTPRMS